MTPQLLVPSELVLGSSLSLAPKRLYFQQGIKRDFIFGLALLACLVELCLIRVGALLAKQVSRVMTLLSGAGM